MLKDGGFLETLEADVVDRMFVVQQKFMGEGKDWIPGELLDLRERQWRNEGSLLETGMIRRATRSDIKPGSVYTADPARSTAVLVMTVEAATQIIPSDGVPGEAYKIKSWLETEYLMKGRTTTDIGKEFDVSAQAIGYWLRKHEIKTRPRGTPKSS